MEGVLAHMQKHAEVMAPKFEAAYAILEQTLADSGIAGWTKAKGGYFFSYVTMPGCASKIVALCKESGVVFTPAGSTHPCSMDPSDSDIRIAPSFATEAEIVKAIKVLALCTKIVSLEKLMEMESKDAVVA